MAIAASSHQTENKRKPGFSASTAIDAIERFLLKLSPRLYVSKLCLYLHTDELLAATQPVNVSLHQELKPRRENAIHFLEHLLVSFSLNLADDLWHQRGNKLIFFTLHY